MTEAQWQRVQQILARRDAGGILTAGEIDLIAGAVTADLKRYRRLSFNSAAAHFKPRKPKERAK